MNLDPKELQTLSQTNPTARAIFIDFSQRIREREHVDVREIKRRLLRREISAPKESITEVLRRLESIGAGQFVTRNRFKFNCSLISLGKTALGESPHPRVLLKDPSKRPVAPRRRPTLPAHTQSPKTMLAIYSLRPGLRVRLELPTDLSVNEVNALTNFIKEVSEEK
jgi:hypothetical protein